jgi:phosphoglycerate dehydrogenase-like enzyme
MPRLSILSRDAAIYHDILQSEALPDLSVVSVSRGGDAIDGANVNIVLGEPDLVATALPHFPALQWIQSTWAGNTPLISAGYQGYRLTAAKGIFDVRIREYVFAYLLYFSRNMSMFHPRMGDPGAVRPTRWSPPEVSDLAGSQLGVLGAGSMATALLPIAKAFGMTVKGLNRRGASNQPYDAMFTTDQHRAFTKDLDYLVCLLPDTRATRGWVNADVLSGLPSHCVLINAGRGSTVDTPALLSALDLGQLAAAVLDVFSEEPLPSEDPCWHHPRVWVTQHTAAISDPAAVARVFADNYRRFLKGTPLLHEVDFERGY